METTIFAFAGKKLKVPRLLKGGYRLRSPSD